MYDKINKKRWGLNMPLSEKAIKNKRKNSIEYAKSNYKRIPLDVTKEKYEQIKSSSQNAGESISGYIKKAIDERMKNQ